jgi:hypothetical protein
MTIANKAKTKSKSRGNPAWKKGGVSPNPTGRPKDGESWSGVIKAIGEMYPNDIIEFVGKDNDLGRAIAKFPNNVQMKYLVTARIFAALMFEPTSALWNGLMERAEGKLAAPIDLSGGGEKITKVIFEYVEDTITGAPQESEAGQAGKETP